VVEAYRTAPVEAGDDLKAAAAAADAVCFTSASTVTGFVEACGAGAVPGVVVCIGPVTADAARAEGLRVDAVADPHTLDGLIDALVGALGTESR
jgi:uroporphyrinogen-III synthase